MSSAEDIADLPRALCCGCSKRLDTANLLVGICAEFYGYKIGLPIFLCKRLLAGFYLSNFSVLKTVLAAARGWGQRQASKQGPEKPWVQKPSKAGTKPSFLKGRPHSLRWGQGCRTFQPFGEQWFRTSGSPPWCQGDTSWNCEGSLLSRSSVPSDTQRKAYSKH